MPEQGQRKRVLIIGAGISGVSCAYHLDKNKYDVLVLEKNAMVGGLASYFDIEVPNVGTFRFDNFVHFSFSNNDRFVSEVVKKTPCYEHDPTALNYYHGKWLKHPVQYYLKGVRLFLRIRILLSYFFRPRGHDAIPQNYAEWLIRSFGLCFAKEFPFAYTMKYWRLKPQAMSVSWVGKRIPCPSAWKLLRGCLHEDRENHYYAKKMRYPKQGGFWNFFANFAKGVRIRTQCAVLRVDSDNKALVLSNGEMEKYDFLVSSIPLTDLVDLTSGVPEDVLQAAKALKCTSGCIVSVGVRGMVRTDCLWFYVYDKELPFARAYISTAKSPSNAPQGYSGIQVEAYFLRGDENVDAEDCKKRVLDTLVEMKLFKMVDVVVAEARIIPYANVVYCHGMEVNRDKVREWAIQRQIRTIGRFGRWEYLWSDQAWEDGLMTAKEINAERL